MIVVEKDARVVVIHHDHGNRISERIFIEAVGAGGAGGAARTGGPAVLTGPAARHSSPAARQLGSPEQIMLPRR
jgi:hypothetical protein